MAGVHADSFDWYTAAQVGRAYDSSRLSGSVAVGAYGPSSAQGVRFSGALGDFLARTSMTWVSGNTFICEVDCRIDAYPASSQNSIIGCAVGAITDANTQATLDVDSAGHFKAVRGDGGTAVNLATSTYTVPLNTNIRLSLKVVIDNSAGEFHLDVYSTSGVKTTVFALTGLDTQLTGSATWNSFFISPSSDSNSDFANLVVMDGSGSENNARIGPAVTLSRRPVLDGAHHDSTPLTWIDHAAMVDDVSADDDVTYNALAASSDTDTFTLEAIPVADAVHFSVVVWQAKSASAPGLKPVARESGTDTVGTAVSVPAAYSGATMQVPYQKAPSGAAWTAAIWNAMEWGYQLDSAVATRVTQFLAIAVVIPSVATVPPLTNGGEIDLIWVEITDRAGTVHPIAEVDLPDRYAYHYGLKLGLLTNVGDLVRKCSGSQGDLYIPSLTFSFFDEDGAWRALAADPATRDFKGLFVVAYGITDASRRAEEPPTVLFRGFTSAHKWTSDLLLEFTVEDPLSKELSSTNDAQQIPKRTIPVDDFAGCSATLVPSSAENYVADGAHLAGVTTVLVRGGVGQFAAGDTGTFAGHATVYTISRSSKTDATWQDLTAAETPETSIELGIALTANVANGEAFTQTPSHTVPAAQGTGVQAVYGLISDTKIIGGDDAGDGQGPVKFIGDAVNDGRLTAWFLWSGHECYDAGLSPFIALNFWNNAVDLATYAASGERLAVPGFDRFDECAPTGYTAGLSFVTINGRDYTIVGLQGVFRDWALGIAPAPPNLGGVPFCVNAYGHKASDGSLLTSAAQIYKHAWKNYLKGDYQGGAVLAAPLYPDGTSMLNEASFDALEAEQNKRIVGGYRHDFIIGANNERIATGEQIRRLNLDNDCDSFWDQDIAFTVAAVDDEEATAAADAETLDDVNDILDESGNALAIDDQDGNLFNTIRFGHTPDYLGREPGGWRSAETGFNEAYHPASVSRHDKIYAPSLEMHCIRGKNRSSDPDDYQQGSDTAANILAWRLRRTAEAPRIYKIPTGMRAFNSGFELGRVIYISAFKNVGGRTPRAVRIQGLVGRPGSDPQGRVVVLEAEDQTRIFSDALSIAFAVGAVDASRATSTPSVGSGSTVTSAVTQPSTGGGGITALTGDVTAGPGSGSQVATIANDAVTNAKAANMAQSTVKGRAVGAGTGDPTDLSATQATAILDAVVGDSGSGGTKGLVPAPAAGDAAAGKFLKANGAWSTPPTGGDVVGPSSSVAGEVALFDGTTGKLIKRATGSGIARVSAGVYGTPGNVVESEITLANNTTNDVSTARHGFAPKAPNNAAVYLDGTGAYSSPSGTGGAAAITTAAEASIPAPSVSGSLFLPNDGVWMQRDTGAAWVPWGPLFPFTDPALSAPTTWINQGSASVDTTNGGIYIKQPATASPSMALRKKAAPATPYTITIALLPAPWNLNFITYALLFRESSSGKLAALEYIFSTNQQVAVEKWTNATTFTATYAGNQRFVAPGVVWLRITDNGTNRISSVSVDGQHWIQFHSVGRTDFLTADEVGFGVSAGASGVAPAFGAEMMLLSWKET